MASKYRFTGAMHDVIIIGGGFAGAAALSRLAGHGLKLVLIEASERLGGRVWTRAFAGRGDLLEFGGSWITPWHQRVRVHAARHDIALRPRSPVTRRAWFDGARLRNDGPVEAGGLADYERVATRIAADARRYGKGLRTDSDGGDVTGISLDAYLARIGAGPAARAQVMAWWSISGNGDPAVVAASELLASCAYGEGRMEGMIEKLCHTLSPGASLLVERMITASGAELAMDAMASAVTQDETGIEVHAADGRGWRARYGVVAVPLNTLAAITFTPGLDGAKAAAAARGHGGRAMKLWLELAGAEVGTLVTGGISGPAWLFVERESQAGTSLAVAFAVDDGSFDPTRPGDVAAAVARLLPEARLLAHDWTDWIGDPFARGTWLGVPADCPAIADAETWRDEGRVMFAGSDIAGEDAGWVEAAITSGEAAAGRILARLAGAGII